MSKELGPDERPALIITEKGRKAAQGRASTTPRKYTLTAEGMKALKEAEK